MNRRYPIWLIVALTPLVLGLCLLFGAEGLGLPSGPARRTILYLRLNRVLAGLLVGAGLSSAGVVLQALLRNPLAEPYVLGISSGAGLGAGLAILAGAAAVSFVAVPLSAFLAGMGTLLLVYRLASQRGGPSIYSLLLSGVIVSAMCSSILMFVISIAPVQGLHSVVWWMLGNLEVYARGLLRLSGLVIPGGVLAIWLLAPELNALTLGREMAHHVGVRAHLAMAAGLTLATLVAATAVALSGLIGFVGLIVPHAMRLLVGPDHRRLVPASALAGGMFLAVCDAVARTVLAPREIPVGVITALLGGPFFLILLRKRRARGWIE